MSGSAWKKIIAYGLLLLLISLWSPKAATVVGGGVLAGMIIRNPDVLTNIFG